MKKEFKEILEQLEQVEIDFEKANCNINPIWGNHRLDELEIQADENAVLALLKTIALSHLKKSDSLPEWVFEKFPISVISFKPKEEDSTTQNPFLDKLIGIGCVGILLFIIASTFIGIGTILTWIF